MEVEFTGRQVTITDGLRAQAEAGISRIDKLIGSGTAHVILTAEKYRQIAEVTVTTRLLTLVATCEATDMETALHDTLAKIEQQAIRHNQKKTTIRRHPKSDLKSVSQAQAELEIRPEPS